MEDEIIITYDKVKEWLTEKVVEIEDEPFLSEDVLFILINRNQLPAATELSSFLKEHGHGIIFKEYWGKEIPLNSINKNLNGLFISDTTEKKGEGIGIEIVYPEEVAWPEEETSEESVVLKLGQISSLAVWETIRKKYLIDLEFLKIVSGNILFTKEQYIQTIQNNTLQGINEVSTFET